MFQRPRRQSLSTLQQSQFVIEVRSEADLNNAIIAAATKIPTENLGFGRGFHLSIVEPIRITTKILIPEDAPGLSISSPGKVPITASKDLETMFEIHATNTMLQDLQLNTQDTKDIETIISLAPTAWFTNIINVTAQCRQFLLPITPGAHPPRTEIGSCIIVRVVGGAPIPDPIIQVGSIAKIHHNLILGETHVEGREAHIIGNDCHAGATPVSIRVSGPTSGACSIANNTLNASTIDTTAAAFGSVISGNVP